METRKGKKHFQDDILQKMDGDIQFGLMNAYMFVAVLQKNREALKDLIASILELERSEILKIEILNPIRLGEALDEKDCVLDLFVLVNGNIKINLEMQVLNEGNWNNRGVYYLAKNIAELKEGEDYNDMKTVVQVGILDFNLWKDGDNPFFQKYQLWDRKNNRLFNDRVSLNVVCLKQLEKASETERRSGLFDWAKAFKVKTWKELKNLSEQNNAIKEAAVTLASLSNDEQIRIQCDRQEKARRDRLSAIKGAEQRGLEQGLEALVHTLKPFCEFDKLYEAVTQNPVYAHLTKDEILKIYQT